MRSPTSRTLQFFKKAGCAVKVVEKWNQWARVRQDLWGADLLVRQGQLLMAIQSTSDANHAKRVTKSIANAEIRNWLDCGVPFYIYSWGKRGPRGKRKLWQMRVTQLVVNGNDKVMVL